MQQEPFGEILPRGLRLGLHLGTAEVIACQRGGLFTFNDTNTLLRSVNKFSDLMKKT